MNWTYMVLLTCLILGSACSEKANKQDETNAGSGSSLELISAQLDSIHTEDQKYRMLAQELGEKVGFEADTFQKVISKMMDTDLRNTEFVTEILDEYGWLGIEEIGSKANSTLFLVIQHAEIEVQEKYLPMMRKAVRRWQGQGI